MATNEELLKTVFFLRNYEILLMKMAFPLNKFQSTRTIAVLLLYHCITIFFFEAEILSLNYTIPSSAKLDSPFVFPNLDPITLEIGLFLDSKLYEHFQR